MSKAIIKTALIDFAWFVLINILLGVILLFSGYFLMFLYSLMDLFWFVLPFLFLFLFGFLLGLLQFKLSKRKKDKRISLLITYVLGTAIYSLIFFVIHLIDSDLAVTVFKHVDILALFVDSLIVAAEYDWTLSVCLTILSLQLLFFCLGSFVQNVLLNRKKKANNIDNEASDKD